MASEGVIAIQIICFRETKTEHNLVCACVWYFFFSLIWEEFHICWYSLKYRCKRIDWGEGAYRSMKNRRMRTEGRRKGKRWNEKVQTKLERQEERSKCLQETLIDTNRKKRIKVEAKTRNRNENVTKKDRRV